MRMENISLVQTTFRLPLDVTAHQQLQLATFLRMAVTLAALNAALKPALLLLWLLFSLHP